MPTSFTQHSVAARPVAPSSTTIVLSAGVAEFRRDDDAVSFFQRADEALYRAKQRGKAQIQASAGEAS